MADGSVWGGVRRIFGRRPPAHVLTASGSPLVEPRRRPGQPVRSSTATASGKPDPSRPDAIRARSAKWQDEVLAFAEAVPEVAGASALVSCSVARVRFVVEGGNDETRKRIQARIDALDTERIAELIWLSGESYVVWPADPGSDAEPDVSLVDKPYSLSVLEFKPARERDQVDQVKGPNGEWVDLPEGHDYMRIWRPSKTNRWQAYSPHRAARDLIDAMWLSQRVDTATQKSRLVQAGIVFWPTNAPDIPVKAGEDPEPGSRQAMLQQFTEATQQVVAMDSKGQEPVTPFIVFYDPGGTGGQSAEYKPVMFRTERDDLAAQYATRTATYRDRYASAVELPVEAVTGMGETNHWSAWQIDVDKWKTYFAPLCEMIRVELEARAVRPYGDKYTLTVDASALVAKPDATPTIMQLAQLEMATPDSVKEALRTGSIEDLVMQDPPMRDYKSNSVSRPPSDFKVGGDRGGGKYREQP